MQAMILAAGFGTRLLPYTLKRPKPLFPILNTPLLLATIRRMQSAGIEKIVVNSHHLKDQLRSALADFPGVMLQEEEVILGTGGGLRKAAAHFDEGPVLITNGDIYHTVDYRMMLDFHRSHSAKVSLALHDYPRFNCIETSEDRVTAFGDLKSSLLAFTGIHVVEAGLLFEIPQPVPYCIIDFYRELLRNEEEIKMVRVDNCHWTDMGTPEDYLALHEGLILGTIPRWKELGNDESDTYVQASGGLSGKNVKVLEWACVGHSVVGDDVTLERAIVWDGASIKDGAIITDAIVVE